MCNYLILIKIFASLIFLRYSPFVVSLTNVQFIIIFIRCILYLKLFIGMGFLWISEILQKVLPETENPPLWCVYKNPSLVNID